MRQLCAILCGLFLSHCAADTPGFSGGNQSDPYLGPIPADFRNELTADQLALYTSAYRLRFASSMALYQVEPERTSGLASCRALNDLVGEMITFDQEPANGFALTPGNSCYSLTREQNLKFSGAMSAALASLELGSTGNDFPDNCVSLMSDDVSARAGRAFTLVANVGPNAEWHGLQRLDGNTWVGGNGTHLASRTTMQFALADGAIYKVVLAMYAERVGEMRIGRVETLTSKRDGKTFRTMVKTEIIADMEAITMDESTAVTTEIDGEVVSHFANELALTPTANSIAVTMKRADRDGQTEDYSFTLRSAAGTCTQ